MTSPSLEDLGWTPRFAAAFEPFRADGVAAARVSLEHTHIYRVIAPEGERLARVSGRLRHDASARADFPAVGDWVVVEDAGGGDARIKAVLPRATHFSRRAAGNPTQEQVVAANIDVVFLVSGLDHDFNPRRIERYLVTAWESGAAPVIVLNKADLVEDAGAFVAEVSRPCRGCAGARRVGEASGVDGGASRSSRGRAHRGAAGILRSGEVVDRQRARRRRGAAHARSARERQPRTSHHDRPSARACSPAAAS